MGAVYEGVRAADGKRVAIKLLAADLAEKPTARARFLNEATLTARVPHPHVVAVKDSGEASEGVYLVMDLLEGEDLARRLRRTGPMSVGEAVDVLDPICEALASAHRAGVTHRDLKPSNIFLAVRDGQPHPMLLDFGVATDEAATEEGRVSGAPAWNGVGTPMYLAPELAADHRTAGPASDQYALGAVLFEMLTGEPPYAAENLPQLLKTIAAGNPPSARARRPELPPKLDAVVLRAMSADPQGRFPSLEDLGRALQAFAVSPDAQEQAGGRRPASSPAISPAIAREAETPSPFVRTLVPEHEAKSEPWFVAPDGDELSEDEAAWFESESPAADSVSAGSASEDLSVEDPGTDGESPGVALASPRVEAASARTGDAPMETASSLEEGLVAPRTRAFPAVDWKAVSGLVAKNWKVVSGLVAKNWKVVSGLIAKNWKAVSGLVAKNWPVVSGLVVKHRRIVLPSGVALLGITLLLVLRGGHPPSRPVSVPPAAVTVTAPPAPPPSTAAVEKTEPALPAPPPSTAAVEKTKPAPAAPPPAAATVEKVEPAPSVPAPPPAATVLKPEPAPAAPPAATAAVEKTEPPPAAPVPAAATVVKREPPAAPVPAIAVEKTPVAPAPAATAAVEKRERPQAARRIRPAPAPAQESPPPKVVAPSPAPKPRAPESAPVRMHNGVPLLD
jgi:serine/threonine-protein kinase